MNGRNQLQTIIDLHRTEQPATHFLCIPLDAEHMEEKFADFKEKVLELNVCIITLVGLIFARLNFATLRKLVRLLTRQINSTQLILI